MSGDLDDDPASAAQTWGFGAVLLVIATLALGFRLYNIGAKEFVYDEGAHAWYSWNLLVNAEYQYSGYYHGPPLYYLSAIAFAVVNPSVVVGRVLISVCSLGIYPALYLLRDRFPKPALVFVGIVYAFHPMVVWTSRFYRNDILTVVGLFLFLAAFAVYQSRHRARDGVVLGLTGALAAAPKEVGYILVPALLGPTLLLAHAESRYASRSLRRTLAESFPAPRWPIPVGFVVGVLVLYSGVPPRPGDAPVALVEGLRVWVERGSGTVTPTRYITSLSTGSPLLLIGSFLGVVTTYLRPDSDSLRWNAIGLLAVTSAFLSFTPHQNKHLLTIIFVPLLFVAALGIFDVVERCSQSQAFRSVLKRFDFGPSSIQWTTLALVGVLVVTLSLVPPPAQHIEGITQPEPDDPKRSLGTHTAALAEETNCGVYLGPNEFSQWPYRWYLRHHDMRIVNSRWTDSNRPYDHAEMWPAIVVNREPIAVLENRTTVVDTVAQWRIYYPVEGC